MYVYEIRKLTSDFYNYYDRNAYPELLCKLDRSYDVIVFELEVLNDCFVAVPFRTEMRHKIGYRFRFSERSRLHQSGLDYTKIAIIHKSNSQFIGEPSLIDFDEFIEFKRNEDRIHKNIQKYILNYIKHMKGESILDSRKFNREYQYSTLQYFHSELGIN